jgi:hypothetical protein
MAGICFHANRDCSWEFRDPIFVGQLVEICVHDDLGIDITNDGTLLGDWQHAGLRCDEFLEWKSEELFRFEHVAL